MLQSGKNDIEIEKIPLVYEVTGFILAIKEIRRYQSLAGQESEEVFIIIFNISHKKKVLTFFFFFRGLQCTTVLGKCKIGVKDWMSALFLPAKSFSWILSDCSLGAGLGSPAMAGGKATLEPVVSLARSSAGFPDGWWSCNECQLPVDAWGTFQ